MKKMKKTYGVVGLLEWHAMIPVGGARVYVNFTGGSLTGYGVTPAEYTTEEAFMQQVIENSDYFKNGKIVLLREVELGGEVKTKPSKVFAKAERPAAETSADAQGTVAEGPAAETIADAQGTVAEGPAAEATGTERSAEANAGEILTVTVADLEEARDYLAEMHDMSRSKLRSKQAILDGAKEVGVQFKGI